MNKLTLQHIKDSKAVFNVRSINWLDGVETFKITYVGNHRDNYITLDHNVKPYAYLGGTELEIVKQRINWKP